MAMTVDIVTPERLVFSGPASQVQLPGWDGQFCALEAHELNLSLLRGGVIKTADQHLVVGRGFAEISGDRATILVDHCEAAGTFSVAEAESQYTEAETAIGASAFGSAERQQAVEKMELARARMSQ